jgi:hypothetical protein
MQLHDVEWGTGLATLVVARLLDLLVVCLLFLVAAASQVSLLPAEARSLASVAAGASFALLVVLASLPMLGERLLLPSLAWLGRRDRLPSRWWTKIAEQAENAQNALALMRTKHIYAAALSLSVLIWLCTYAWFFCYLRGIAMPLELGQVVLGASFAVISKSLPIGSIAGFGAHEVGWAVGFTLMGHEASAAILSGFAVNMLTLLASMLFGLGSLCWLTWKGGRSIFSYLSIPGNR